MLNFFHVLLVCTILLVGIKHIFMLVFSRFTLKIFYFYENCRIIRKTISFSCVILRCMGDFKCYSCRKVWKAHIVHSYKNAIDAIIFFNFRNYVIKI